MSDEEDYEEVNNLEEYDGKKNVTIILLDVCSGMFEDDTKLFKLALASIDQIMHRMLLQPYRRNLSICLIKDDDITLTSLSDNFIESAKRVHELLKTSNNDLRNQLERKTQTISMRNCLSECLKQFSNTDKINMHIVVLTSDDDPHRGDQNENATAFNVALSFRDLNAKLIVLPMRSEFDYDLFYTELLKVANDVPLDLFDAIEKKNYDNPENLIEILECIIKEQVYMRRYRFRLFEDSENEQEVSFWVQLHYLIKEKHLYHNLNMSRVTLNRVRREFPPDLSIDPDREIFKRNGSKTLIIDKSDKLRAEQNFGFRLLAVSSTKQCSIHRKFKRGFLIESDELSDQKEQKLFEFLWEYCRDKNRVLVCGYFTPGYHQEPNIVELVPDLFQAKRCFVGDFLPNSDQLKFPVIHRLESVPDLSANDSDSEGMRLMSDVVDKLKISYNPRDWNSLKYDAKAVHLRAQLLGAEPEEACNCFPTNQDVRDRLGETAGELAALYATFVTSGPSKPKRKKK